MAHVARQGEAFCIDRWEASLELSAGGVNTPWPGNRVIDGDSRRFFALSAPGVKPQGYISGRQAAQACLNSGKRLCSEREWRTACRGSANTRYPYGDARKPNRCNDRFKVLDRHPVVRLFDEVAARDTPRSEMWNLPWMNDPRLHQMPDSVAASGEFPECTNDYGVYDMVGNLHEWLLDEKGSFAGGFFMDTYQNGEGCEYRTRAHSFDYHDYSTGFRCCSDSR
jgi:formylglycine-generating enzyme required for sulfatase activity